MCGRRAVQCCVIPLRNSKQYAAILAEVMLTGANADASGSSAVDAANSKQRHAFRAGVVHKGSCGHALTREKLQRLLGKASRAQQRELRWRIIPYNVTSESEFITITANLEGLPWILLDLRGRLQPFLLRVGVGIGELSVHFQQPAKNLKGQCIAFAREAVDSLRAEHLLVLESRGSRTRERQDARGNSHSGDLMSARLPLTRFRSINFDFDATVNEICRLQDSLIHKMRATEWNAFVPEASSSQLRGSYQSRKSRRSEDAFDARRERIRENGRLGNFKIGKPFQAFRRAYFAQLMAAAAGVQHLITERFLAQYSWR